MYLSTVIVLALFLVAGIILTWPRRRRVIAELIAVGLAVVGATIIVIQVPLDENTNPGIMALGTFLIGMLIGGVIHVVHRNRRRFDR